MSAVTRTSYHLVHMAGVRDEDMDLITIVVRAEAKEYAVVISGPSGMSSTDVSGALRGATAHYISAAGGDASVVGAQSPDEALMDTGTQRPN
jgi:hypothetical protein